MQTRVGYKLAERLLRSIYFAILNRGEAIFGKVVRSEGHGRENVSKTCFRPFLCNIVFYETGNIKNLDVGARPAVPLLVWNTADHCKETGP